MSAVRTPASGWRSGQAAWDGLSWVVAMPLAALLRYDGNMPEDVVRLSLLIGLGAGLLQVGAGLALRIYQGRYLRGSFDEVFGVVLAAFIATIALGVLLLLFEGSAFPRSTPLIAVVLAVALMLAGRFVMRVIRRRFRFSGTGDRTLIYGAGKSGYQLISQMIADPAGAYLPVGFLDDNPAKRHLHIAGKRVLGTGADLEAVVKRTSASTLVVADTHATAAMLSHLDDRCTELGIELRVVPSASEFVGGTVRLGDVAQVTDEDLLGRRPIETDEAALSRFLMGKRLLITGAGGSIGSELARQVHRYDPSCVGLLDRDESALQAVQLSIDGQGLLSSDNLILADVRDAERMNEVLQRVRPDIVFHAAALKHLPLLERNPDEGFKTNVAGTANVLAAAQAAGVPVFVNISTDKAADPASVLGHTKLATELLTAGVEAAATDAGARRYLSVRFGNVLGSRGSVLTTFRVQIDKGGPVTVTDPEVTRYFMTVSEAVHLVLQASVIGEHGQTLILDMGQPVRIDDVARQMIAKSGRSVEISYTGLRPGEKLHEVLFSAEEAVETTSHPLIWSTHAVSGTPLLPRGGAAATS